MRIQGAVIKEQGCTFAIVVVKQHVVNNSFEANKTIRAFQGTFGHVPIVLMAQDAFGRATYYGRRDIVDFMSTVPPEHVPWREYYIN